MSESDHQFLLSWRRASAATMPRAAAATMPRADSARSWKADSARSWNGRDGRPESHGVYDDGSFQCVYFTFCDDGSFWFVYIAFGTWCIAFGDYGSFKLIGFTFDVWDFGSFDIYGASGKRLSAR